MSAQLFLCGRLAWLLGKRPLDAVSRCGQSNKGHVLFAHTTLTRSERSPIAALVTEMLEDLPG